MAKTWNVLDNQIAPGMEAAFRALEDRVLTQCRRWDEERAPTEGRYMVISLEELAKMMVFDDRWLARTRLGYDEKMGIAVCQLLGVHIIAVR